MTMQPKGCKLPSCHTSIRLEQIKTRNQPSVNMSGNNRNRQSNTGPSLIGAALGVVAGLAAVEHVHARQENRESIVQGLVRWVREDVLELPSIHRRPRTSGGAADCVLTRADINALPVRVLADDDVTLATNMHSTRSNTASSEKAFCVICRDSYACGDSLMRLPCFHEYHAECIRDCLESSEDPLCPVCRHPVATRNS